MAITFIAEGHSAADTTSPVTVPVPSGTLDGHVLIAMLTIEQNRPDLFGMSVFGTDPGGWTLIDETALNAGASGATVRTLRRVASSEPASYNWTWTLGGTNRVSGIIAAYSGVDNTTPLDTARTVASSSTATATDPAAITTVTDGALVLTAPGRAVQFTYGAVPTNQTERLRIAGAAFADNIVATHGAFDPAAYTPDVSGDAAWVAHTIALRPQAPINYTKTLSAILSFGTYLKKNPDAVFMQATLGFQSFGYFERWPLGLRPLGNKFGGLLLALYWPRNSPQLFLALQSTLSFSGTQASQTSKTLRSALRLRGPFANIATNTSFEPPLGVSQWVADWATAAASSAQAFHGTQSAELTAINTNSFTFEQAAPAQNYVVQPGINYVASFYLRPNTTVRNAVASIAWINAAGNIISTSSGTLGAETSGAWVRFNSGSAHPAPADAVSARGRIAVGNPVGGEIHYVDAYQLEVGDTPTAYDPNEAALNKLTSRALRATLALAGASLNQTRRTLAATLALGGSLTRQTGKLASGTLSFLGSLPRRANKGLTATLPLGYYTSSPSDLSGLVRWYKADSLALSDNDPVGTWTDSSSSAQDATQAGVKRPTYKTNVVGGKPVVRFDGVDDVMFFTALTGLADFDAMAVLKVDSGDSMILGSTGFGAPSTWPAQLRIGEVPEKLTTYDGAGATSNTLPVSQTDWSTVEFSRATSTVSFFQNNVALGTGTMQPTSEFDEIGNTSNDAAGPWRLGGDIAEIALWNRALTAGERSAMYAYVAQKYFGGVNLTKQTRRTLSATLVLTGFLNASRLFFKALAGTLAFVGSLTKRTGKALPATLVLNGAITRRTSHVMTATLALVGSLARLTSRTLSATLIFVGAALKSTSRTLAATLALTGATATLKAFNRLLQGTLAFGGLLAKQTTHVMPATLALTGSVTRFVTYPLSATLAFVGTTTKQTRRALAATLALVGNTSLVKVFVRLLQATLALGGSLTKQTGKLNSATLALLGSLPGRLTAHRMTATLALVGATLNQTRRTLTATLVLNGSVVANRLYARLLQATLAFSGAVTKRAGKLNAGTLAFTGAITRRVGKLNAATLALVGAIPRNMTRSLSATLSFVGTGLKQTRRALAGTLRFVGIFDGTLSTVKLVLLQATLAFSGALKKRPGKLASGTLSFTGALTRSWLGQIRAATEYVVTILGRIAYAATHRGADARAETIRGATAYYPAIRGVTAYRHA